MKATDIPGKIQLPFANSAGAGYKRTVPVASQIGVVDGAASYTDGFPPLNFLPVASGGVPPFGQDFNGLLNAISALSRWFSSGAPIAYDAAFSTAIGGYPKGAIVQSVTTFGKVWLCTADDNTSDPDAGGANWQEYPVFEMSLTMPGYIKFAGGFIVQWGLSGPLAGNSTEVETLPIAFPTAGLIVLTSPQVTAGSESGQSSSGAIVSKTQISVSNTGSLGTAMHAFWAVFGY